MITSLSRLALLAALAACGCRKSSASTASPPSPPSVQAAQPAAAQAATSALDALPIAQYLGSDDATGNRVFALLRGAGIDTSAGGSMGYSVWVPAADRKRARDILVAASNSECLPVTVFDDTGMPLARTQPARCKPPKQPAPAPPLNRK